MVDPLMLLAFAAAVFAIVITPGADMAIIVTSALGGGRAAGLAAVVGVALGALAHIAFSAVGLSALVAASPSALTLLGWFGTFYLLWIGVAFLRAGGTLALAGPAAAVPARAAWRRAVLTNLLNPKAYLFMLAIFPQFMRRDGWPTWLQALLLGALILAIAVPVYSVIALAAARAGGRLTERPGAARWINRSAGAVLLTIAATMAAAQAAGLHA